MPYFDFRTIAELLEDNSNRKQKEFLLDELTQFDEKNGTYAHIEVEGIVYDIIEHLGKYAGCYRNKHGTKKSCKCQEGTISNALVGLEKILQEYVKQIQELQIELLKCSGKTVGTVISTKKNEIPEGIVAKSSIGKSDGWTGLAGGAVGGAGGGLAAELKNVEKVGGSESKVEEKELGPGATGGATGGALGSAGISTTERDAIGLEDATEIAYDVEIDRFNIKN